MLSAVVLHDVLGEQSLRIESGSLSPDVSPMYWVSEFSDVLVSVQSGKYMPSRDLKYGIVEKPVPTSPHVRFSSITTTTCFTVPGEPGVVVVGDGTVVVVLVVVVVGGGPPPTRI